MQGLTVMLTLVVVVGRFGFAFRRFSGAGGGLVDADAGGEEASGVLEIEFVELGLELVAGDSAALRMAEWRLRPM